MNGLSLSLMTAALLLAGAAHAATPAVQATPVKPSASNASSVLPLPKALVGIKRSTGVCPLDDKPAGTVAVAHPAPDLTCLLPASRVAELAAQPQTLLVDTRPAQLTARYGIASAMPMEPGAIALRSYLKTRPLVLFGDGRSDRDLLEACSTLKADGFKQVSVLQGGVRAWAAAGQPLQGDAPATTELATLDATQLWAASQFANNVVLTTPDMRGLRASLINSHEVAEVSPQSLKKVLEQRRKEVGNQKLAAVAIAVPHRPDAATLAQLQKAVEPAPLWVYSDTPAAFNKAMTQQKAVWTAQARGPKRINCSL